MDSVLSFLRHFFTQKSWRKETKKKVGRSRKDEKNNKQKYKKKKRKLRRSKEGTVGKEEELIDEEEL